MENIYLLRNKANGKVYVGRTSKFNFRKKLHINNLRANRHTNKMLQDDFNSYGEENFEFEIVEESEKGFGRSHIEHNWMKKLKTYDSSFGYNIKDPYFFNNGKPTKNYMVLFQTTVEELIKE